MHFTNTLYVSNLPTPTWECIVYNYLQQHIYIYYILCMISACDAYCTGNHFPACSLARI